jgi:hypothetical protein
VFQKLKNMEKILNVIKEQRLIFNEEKNSSSKYLDDSNDLEIEDNFDFENNEKEDEENKYKLLQYELAALDQETLKSKLELEKWKQEAKIFENMLRQPDQNNEILSEINSDIISKRDESVIKILYFKFFSLML